MSNDRKHLKKIAPLGGKATLAKFGSSHFSLLAKKSWIKRKNTLNIHNVHHVLKQAIDNAIKYDKTLQNPSEDNR